MATQSTHLLINTGSRRSRSALPEILEALATYDIDVQTIHKLTAGQQLGELCQQIIKQKPGLLIICGGDGTVSYALGQFAGSTIELAIIPLGTTNNFARSLRLPLTIAAAAEIIANTTARPVDLGTANRTMFANVLGIGMSAQIAKHTTDRTKKVWGRLAYALVGCQQLLRHKPFVISVTDTNKELSFSFETHQAIIANGRYHAGKQIAADAAVDNRELIIFTLGGRSKLNFLWHTFDFYVGKRKRVVHSSYVIGKNVQITTNSQQPVEVDGEPKLQTPLHVQVAAKAVRVRY